MLCVCEKLEYNQCNDAMMGRLLNAHDNQGGSRILRRRGCQPSREGVPTYYFPKFSEKLHEIEKILDRRGGACRERPPPLDPPLLTDYLYVAITQN